MFRSWKSATGCGSADGVQFRNSDWCADFSKYVWKNAGVRYADIAEGSGGVLTGWASSFKDYGVKYGTWHSRASGYTPQPGDALVFDWEQDGVINHVGIVKSATADTVYTIEGNSGNQIKANSYSRSNADIVGYSSPVGITSEPEAPPAGEGNSTQFGDLDGDGRDEIVAFFGDGNVHAYRNRGWDDPKVYDGPDQKIVAGGFTDPSRAKFADLDGDGRDEIVSFFPDGTVHAYRNRGWNDATVYNGNDQKVVASGFTDPSRAKFGDVDGDGRAELISFFPDGTVHAYRNRGWNDATVYNGNDQKVVASGFTDPSTAKFADIDGDGRAELVSFFGDGTVHAYRNRGWSDATVYNGNDQKVVASGFTEPFTAKFADIDGDGRAELVSFFADEVVHAYRNRGWNDATVYNGNDQKIVASGFTP
ncbi:FG-GAP-like repeat-containing protein [Streptosporangium subroseum]|uniref:FG-GAP-like repeat-containing protein n=1 Tax=Streptosporangium subroseum TaxID=106412 RepID=UPI00308A1EC8|nr:FG-GAP-like repeat-containing protein [Streptosporangium subroseum]